MTTQIKRLLRALRLLLLPAPIFAALPMSVGMAQSTGDWRVYMKEADCAATLRDWMTVASEPPVAGLNVYSPARSPNEPFNNVFPLTLTGFAAAQTRADFLRVIGIATETETGPVASYSNYCCPDYWAWFKQEPDGTRRFSMTHGPENSGWEQLGGGLCCEQAAALTGLPGLCNTFTLSTGQVIRFTEDGWRSLEVGAVTLENVVISPSIAPPAHGSASLASGVYAASVEVAGTRYDFTWTLVVDGNSVSGNMEWSFFPGNPVPLVNGRIDGTRLTIERDCTGEGGVQGPCRQVFEGEIAGDGTVAGTWSATGPEAGTWTAPTAGTWTLSPQKAASVER